jgi:hypothetical protein
MTPSEPEAVPPEPPDKEILPDIPDDAGMRATIEAFLFDLDAAFAAELAQATERLNAARGSAEQALAEAGTSLGKSREKLAAVLQDTKAAPALDKAGLRRLAAEIDGQLTWIFRKVRPAVDRELRNLAPRKKPVETFPARIAHAYARATAALPDELPPPPTAEMEPAAGKEGLSALVWRFMKPLADRLRYLAETNLQLTPRGIAEEILAARPEPGRHPQVRQYEKFYQQTASRIADIWRGVRFHLEMAADDLEERLAATGKETAESAALTARAVGSAEMALEVLAEAQRALPTALSPLTPFFEELPEHFTREHQEFTRTLRQELESVDSREKTLRHLGRQLLRKLLELRERARTVLEQGREEMHRSASSGIAQTGNLLKNIQAFLGVSGKTEEALLTLTDLPSRAQIFDRARRLPARYQRLFTLGPLKHREFLVAREDELEDLEEIFKRWQAGKACSVALIGPEGSGKTSLVNCFESQFGSKAEFLRMEIPSRLQSEADVLHFFGDFLGIEKKLTSLDELVTHLLAGPRRVLVFEEGFRLGLRVIGGFRAVKAFLFVLMATRRHCLWLVTFRKFSWARLDHHLGISQYFTHQVRTLFHDQDEIRDAILLRHRTSGLPLIFETDADESEPTEETRAASEEKFFRELFEASSGSIEAAIYFWLLSVTYDEGDKAIKASPLGKPEYGFIRALGRDYLFALGEVLSHGELTSAEYCEIFRRDPFEGRMILDYLVELNILLTVQGEKDESPLRYSLNPIFFGPTAQVLESLNILY